MFPAHAGMILEEQLTLVNDEYVPRTRGDDPQIYHIILESFEMFPAHAGMILILS